MFKTMKASKCFTCNKIQSWKLEIRNVQVRSAVGKPYYQRQKLLRCQGCGRSIKIRTN